MLKRKIPEIVLFFDMEWVPCAAAARRLYDLPPGTPDLEAIKRLWKEHGAETEQDRPFVKYLFSRIVSIAFLSRKIVFKDGEERPEFGLNSLPKLPVETTDVDEAHLIERFLSWIGERRPQLVGYNSYAADVQVLIQRGLINEVSAPMFCRRPENKWDPGDYFGRWDNEEHLDLLKLFSNGKMTPKLNDMARLCGFPGKLDINGEHVVDLWLQGDLTRIVEYNQIDVLNTYLLWLRVVHFCGKMKEEAYMNETEEFRYFLEAESQKPEKQFIAKFLEKWEM
jgi:predicted PolB exonuclease-like 3'-5' exonuclease